MEVLTGVIAALASVILTLTALLRFYLPRHDRQLHNPWANQLLQEMQAMRRENGEHHIWEKGKMEAIEKTLERMESKLS